MTQITENQHFVPRFYLKRFAGEGQIQIFDVRAKRIGKPRPYASVCYEKYFYAVKTGVQDEISQKLEGLFGKIENVIADSLPGVIEHAVDRQLTSSDLDVLANFMSVQWIRTPHFRDLVQEVAGIGLKQIVKKLAICGGLRSAAERLGMSGEQIEGMERFILSGQYNIRIPNNALPLSFVKEIPIFSCLLLAKKWRIVLSEEPYRFITSDNPVAGVPPRTGLIPVTFMDRRYLLALTPNILIETGRPDSMNPEQQPVDRVSYHTANEKAVLMFNKVLANSAHEYAYASQRDELEQLLNLSRSRGALSPAGP